MKSDTARRLRVAAKTPESLLLVDVILNDVADEIEQAEKEIAQLRALLNDARYIQMKADYNNGQLSWANMIEERERGLGLKK